jgi:hypothetical protein
VLLHQDPQLLRHRLEPSHQRLQPLTRDRGASRLLAYAPLGKGDRQPLERQQLAQERLGGGHAHLNAGADVHHNAHQPPQ